MNSALVPTYDELMWPALEAVRALGHVAKIEEIDEYVLEHGDFSAAQVGVLHNKGPRSEIEYRLAWARTYLKGIGALDNPQRGVWATTDVGKTLHVDELEPLRQIYLGELREAKKKKALAVEQTAGPTATGDGESIDQELISAETNDWREQLIAHLLAMSPEGFEHLAKRLLRAAGFVNTSVTARGKDGGIDGTGVYRVSLISFPVFFQCKRYSNSVSSDKVRDFRGAMAGRGDKGLLITTATFTADAKKEATRDGAPPVDLIDGELLCDLLKQYGLGIRTTVKEVEEIVIDGTFFSTLDG